jgi:hypothetical protein
MDETPLSGRVGDVLSSIDALLGDMDDALPADPQDVVVASSRLVDGLQERVKPAIATRGRAVVALRDRDKLSLAGLSLVVGKTRARVGQIIKEEDARSQGAPMQREDADG